MNNLQNQLQSDNATFSKEFMAELTMFDKNNRHKNIYNRHFTRDQKWFSLCLPKVSYIALFISFFMVVANLKKDISGIIFLVIIFAVTLSLIIMLRSLFRKKREHYNMQVYNKLYARDFDYDDYLDVTIKDIRKNNILILLNKHNIKKDIGTYNKLHYIFSNIKSRSAHSTQIFSIIAIMMATTIITMYMESRYHAFSLFYKESISPNSEDESTALSIFLIIAACAIIFYMLYLLIKVSIILISHMTSTKNRHITVTTLEQLIVEQLR